MFNYNKINALIDKKQQEDKQITIAQIASGIGLSDPGLRNIKTGKSVPSVEMLEKIADYFGVDMNYFFSAAELKDYLAEKPKHMVLNESNSNLNAPKTHSHYVYEFSFYRCNSVTYHRFKNIYID